MATRLSLEGFPYELFLQTLLLLLPFLLLLRRV